MEPQYDKYKHIKGWGVDADPENEPTYPMKEAGEETQDIPRPALQTSEKEILQSNERPYMTAVFGTTVPPSGLSGHFRRFAFRYSESNLLHWISLLLADRINVVEGLADDFKKGYIPNILTEKGWKSEWKYNREKSINRIACIAGITALAITVAVARKKKRKRNH